MAILINPTQGKIKGKIGDVNYREVNGQIIMSKYVPKIKASKSDDSVSNRGDFGGLGRLTKGINAVPVLKAMWKNYPGANLPAKFCKVNRHRIGSDGMINNLIIAPADSYFPVTLNSFSKKGNTISMTCGGFEMAHSSRNYLYISAQGIILMLPNDESDKPVVTGICSKDEDGRFADTVSFSFILDTTDSVLYEERVQKRLLMNVIFKDNNLMPTYVSTNIYLEL